MPRRTHLMAGVTMLALGTVGAYFFWSPLGLVARGLVPFGLFAGGLVMVVRTRTIEVAGPQKACPLVRLDGEVDFSALRLAVAELCKYNRVPTRYELVVRPSTPFGNFARVADTIAHSSQCQDLIVLAPREPKDDEGLCARTIAVTELRAHLALP